MRLHRALRDVKRSAAAAAFTVTMVDSALRRKRLWPGMYLACTR